MPKVDATRNYYADLQLAPASSQDDVKKQYRKLAMQWHPDRNRGREEEASKKFQIIQAAFEILTDPSLKKEYDTARNKHSARFPGASGVRGNPWASAGAEWAPPPKRGNGPNASTGPPPRPAAGASRYSNWGASGGTRPVPKTPQRDDSAKATYEAWNNMRSRPTSQTQVPRRPPPPPGRAPTSATRDSKTSDSEGMPRTASQQQKAKASFGNSTRRTGYIPRSPGLGDEPPVSNNNYFTTRTHTNIFNETTSRQRRASGATAPAVDPLAQFKDNFMDERQSTPYTTAGGEKTSLFDGGAGVGRSKSTRMPSRNGAEATGGFPFPRRRSSSTPRSSSNDGGSEDSTKANTGAPGSRGTSGANRSSTRPSDRYRPKSAQASHDIPTESDQSTAADGTNPFSASGTTSQQPEDFTTFGASANLGTPGTTTGQKRFASTSADNINTQFVKDEHPDQWEFKAGGVTAEEAAAPKMRSQSGSRLGRRSPTKFNRRPAPPRPSASQESTAQQGSEDTMRTGFSAEEWGAKIGSEHFIPQPTVNATNSPTRRANSRKNSRPVKVTRGGTAGIVDEDDEIPTATRGWQDFSDPPSGAQSPMAMDIDTPPTEKNSETPKASQMNGARTIHVEPTRPEWRAGDANNTSQPQPDKSTINTATIETPLVEDPNAQSNSATKMANPFSGPFPGQNGGSEDSEEFRANFSDFKNVEPFTEPKPTGLQSFADLKTTLPFASKPSEHLSLDKGQHVAPLAFPIPPTAPRLPPPIAVPGLRPSNTVWRKYAHDFYNYMEKWEAFNQKVLDHFAARQTNVIIRRQKLGRTWLDLIQGVDGASAYQAELDQDHEVRKQWGKACDDHQARVREFAAFRDRTK